MNDNHMKTTLDAALWYAEQRFSIFPTGQDKKPLIKWEKYQKEIAPPEQIREWWGKTPEANIGIVTGKISGIAVIDADDPEALEWCEENLPTTPTVETARGRHYYFKNKAGLKNSVKVNGLKLDIRAEGGYVVAPPSIHETGVIYSWHEGRSLDDIPLADFPTDLFKQQDTAHPSTTTTGKSGNYGQAALVSELSKLAGATEGTRNADLNEAAFSLGQLIAGGELDKGAVVAALTGTALSIGLKQSEARATIESGLEAGAREPRTAPESGRREPLNTGTTATDIPSEWPEPSPLPEGLPPVKTLDPDMIPAPLRGWLMDISDRMQIPPDFSTAAAVVALGSIIGRGCGIYPKRHDDWLVVPNLWGAVIGRPSLMKTPAITEAQRHLVRLETEARDKYTEEAHAAETDKEIEKITRAAICENIKKAVKTGDTAAIEQARERLSEVGSEETTRRRYQTQDGTTEKIGELLNQNPRGLLVNRDELIGWFHSLDKAGREGDRAFYLEAWNGTRGYTYDRIGRGTLDIDALCVSIFGAITPGPLSDYVYQASRGGNGDDGLLQRFQVMVWPDTPSEWKNIDRFPDSKEKERAWGIFSKLALDSLGSSVVGQYTGEIPALRFTPSGQEIFDAWRHNLEIRLRSDHGLPPSLESHLAKYRSLMPSLSLIFHLVEVVDGKTTGAVSKTAALMAAAWCDYLETHACRVYGGATMPGMESAREIVKHIRRGAITDGCKPKDIYRNQWSRLATPEEVKAGLDVLSEYDWLTIEKINTGGRPSEIVRLNPGIKV